MTHFFFTNRDIRRPRNKPAYFGDEPTATVSYVTAPTNATTLSPDDRETGTGGRTRWAKKILDAAKREDGTGDIVIYVHGYNNDAEDVFKAHKGLHKNLLDNNLNAAFVSFSWPSRGDFLNYLEDDNDARESAIHLVRSGIVLLAQMTEPDCRIRIHVMAHSMGTLVVREALNAACGNNRCFNAAWGISQLIFFGSDIAASSLTDKRGEELFNKSQRFTNYFNRHDKVLATSNLKRLATSPRLVRHGAPSDALGAVIDVDMSDHWKRVADQNDQNVFGDVPASHGFYRLDKKFAKDVVNTINGDIDRREIPGREPHPREDGRLLMA